MKPLKIFEKKRKPSKDSIVSSKKDFQELIFPPKGGVNSQEGFLFTVYHFILFEVAETYYGRSLDLPKLQETKSELEQLDASPMMKTHISWG